MDFLHDAFWFMVGFIAAFWPVYLILAVFFLLKMAGDWGERN